MGNVQHINDMIIAQRKLLWPLSPTERASRIAEIRADYEYENQLSAVAHAMSEDAADAADEDPRGGMIVVAMVELAIIAFIVCVAIFWSGIGSGAI